jgi:hypothetical protein
MSVAAIAAAESFSSITQFRRRPLPRKGRQSRPLMVIRVAVRSMRLTVAAEMNHEQVERPLHGFPRCVITVTVFGRLPDLFQLSYNPSFAVCELIC